MQNASWFPMRLRHMRSSLVQVCALATLSAAFVMTSCGQASKSYTDIIGGQTVKSGDPIAKHVAALVNDEGTVKCSVTPISESVFMTAAHCVYGRRLDGWMIQTGLVAGKGESLPVAGTIIHHDFAAGLLYSAHPASAPNDIALIQTSSPSAGTIPVPIIRGIARQELTTPFEVTVAGYGRTVGQLSESKGVLQKVRLKVTETDSNLHEFTSEDGEGRMGCHGDSGGPAFYGEGRSIALIGIVSRGDNSCEAGATIFTDVVEFLPFINESIKGFNLRHQAQGAQP
jgi:secreted trypsin-like serine protease